MAEKAKRRGQDLQFFQLSANQPWPQSEFDVVALVDVLHHIPVKERESAFLSAAARVKPGGLLLYKDMAQRPWLPALMNRLHDLIVARQWITYIPVSHVEKWAARNELTLLHAEEISRLWYRHQLRVFKRYDSSGTTAPNKN
jgi:2-polyprenyl-3-methyl-5-hydroxy-6-metoxy-1,4-benzoquinol methylase